MHTRLSKRLFSALLALVMVIVLIPVTVIPALAAEKITITQVNANFNLDRLPKAGDPVVVHHDVISVSSGDVYEVDRSSITWYSDERTGVDANIYYQIYEDINYTGYDKGYCFEAGRTYYMDFTLKIRSQFSQTHSFPRGGLNSDPVNVQFRNLASSEYSVHQVLGWGNTVDICLKITLDGERTYDDIEIVRAHTWATTSYQPTLPPIRDKSAPSFYCHYNNYTVKSVWEGDFAGDNKNLFVAGNTYKLKLIFTAKTGYKFSEDCKFAFDTNVNIEPDPRLNAEPKSITLKDGRTKLEVEFEFLVEDYKMIETVSLESGLDDPMSFLPVSGAKLKDPYNSLGGAISSDKPYEHTYTVNAYEQRVWRDEKDDPITYAPYEGLQYFTFALVVSDSNQYRFGRNLQVELEGIDSKYYWTEIEFREDDKVVYITFYFVSNYHLEDQQTGATLENSMKCKAYKGLKFALENPGIQYVALSNAIDALPFVAPVNVDEALMKRKPAITVAGSKYLTVNGENIFTINEADPTAYLPYEDFINVPVNTDLTVVAGPNGGGITVEFCQPNYPAAIIGNRGTLSVSDVSLYANGLYQDVYPQAINSRGKLTITGGSYKSLNRFPLENGTVMLSFGSETYIDGGTFDATNGNGGTGTNYGLMLLTDQLELEINRGVFKSCGGICLPNDTADLGDYASGSDHFAYSGGMKKDLYLVDKNFIDTNGGTTEIIEEVMDFDIPVKIPVEGQYPQTSVTVDTPKYYVTGTPVWYCNGSVMSESDTFELGNTYSVKVQAKTNREDGYYLHHNIEWVTGKVNGREGIVTDLSNNTVEIEYRFGQCTDSVTAIGISGLTAPRENDTPDFSASADDTTYGLRSGAVKWFKYDLLADDADYVEMASDEKFVSGGYTYAVQILVSTSGTRVFNKNEWGYVCLDATLNGYSCSYENYYDGDVISDNRVYLWKDFGNLPDLEIESIDVGITAPVAGELPTYALTTGHSQFEQDYNAEWYDISGIPGVSEVRHYDMHAGIRWYDETLGGKVLYDYTPFIAGHEYSVYITLKAGSAYNFNCDKWGDTLCTASINGTPAEIYDYDLTEHSITASFICTGEDPTISVSGTVTCDGPNTGDIGIQLLPQTPELPSYEIHAVGGTVDYIFPDVAAGTYTIQVTKAGYTTYTGTVTVGSVSVNHDVTLVCPHSFDNDADTTCNACGITTYPGGNILYKESTGWYHIVDRQKVYDTGLVKFNGVWCYVENGRYNTAADKLITFSGKLYHVKGGRWQQGENTLYKWNGQWYYLKNGVVNNTDTLFSFNNKLYHVKDGKWVQGETKLYKYNGEWYYLVNGVVNTADKLIKYSGKWYHVNGGKWMQGENKLYKYSGQWYALKNGVVNTADTLFSYSNKLYHIKSGYWQQGENILYKYNGEWYYLVNGVVNQTDTLFSFSGKLYHVKGGKWVQGENKLYKYNNEWYCLKNGVVYTATTLFPYSGKLYYVTGGKWVRANTTIVYNGKTYKVVNGMGQA